MAARHSYLRTCAVVSNSSCPLVTPICDTEPVSFEHLGRDSKKRFERSSWSAVCCRRCLAGNTAVRIAGSHRDRRRRGAHRFTLFLYPKVELGIGRVPG